MLIYPEGWGSEEVPATWQDDDVQKLEAHMTDIAVQVIVTAEIKYRENALHQYQIAPQTEGRTRGDCQFVAHDRWYGAMPR